MRDALARSDNDFNAVDQPRPARRKSSAAKKSRGGLFAGVKKKPMRLVGLVAIAGVLLGIGVNATMFQTARHPAPLFASAPEKTVPQKAAAASVAPVPAPRPAELAAASSAPTARPPAQQIARAPAETTTARKDAIAALIKGDEPAAAPVSPKISAAQRALQKVGFVVKPDGVFGLGTRQALERFERDRGLPVTGELAGRTLKELAAQSGVAIP